MIILEGPDGGGKTTVANALQEMRPDARVIHHGPYKEDSHLFPRFLASLLARPKSAVILDRSWLSEPIYGRAMREGEDRVGVFHRRMLERVAFARRAIVVNCLPSWETVHETWASRKDDEYVSIDSQMARVYEGYRELSGATDLPVIRHNRDSTVNKDGHTAAAIPVNYIDGQLNSAGVIGNLEGAQAIILSDRSYRGRDLPFVGMDPYINQWLTYQLELSGIPESQLAWMNVRKPSGSFKSAQALTAISGFTQRRIIALGDVARAWCESNAIDHDAVPCPDTWARYHTGQTYPLIDSIMEAL